jgi:anti-sigma B factor antagonist
MLGPGDPYLDIVTSGDGDSIAVSLTGVLDIATAGQLEAAVRGQVRPGRSVTIDLSGIDLCDSTGLGALVRLHRSAQAAGGQLCLRGARRHVADVLAMTGINKVIVVLPSVDR